MRKIYLLAGFAFLNLLSFAQNFPIDFESSGYGASFTWTTFESGTVPPPLEIVANPDPSGINTSATVAKFTALAVAQPFAGCETQHGADLGSFSISIENAKIKIMVYKTKISDVGIKLVTYNNASLGEVRVANTLINQWEELTFDFSSHINSNLNYYDQIVIFPDFQPRSSDDIIYFDNIGWGGCTSSSSNLSVMYCSLYTTPSGVELTSNGTYQDVLVDGNAYGCDSIITIDFQTPSITTYSVRSCSPYVAPSGTVFPSTGIYFDTIEIFSGCREVSRYDVTVTLEDEAVTVAQSTVCPNGSTTIDLGSSEIGTIYTLRNNADNSTIDGPFEGTGSAMTFNTGVISNTMTYNIYAEREGVQGSSLTFDGVNDYVNANMNINATSYSELTFEGWIYPTEIFSAVRQTIFTHGTENDRGLFIQAGTDKWFVTVGNGGYWSTASVDLNQWQHIAVVYDDANNAIRFYKNGVEYTEPVAAVTSFSASGNDLNFGAQNGYYGFNGSIDGVKIWSTQLGATELIANMDSCFVGDDANLVAYYKFNDGDGSTVASDAGLGAHHATLGSGSSTPSWGAGHENCATCSSEFAELVTVNYSLCAGVEDRVVGEMHLYPNPTNGDFAIEFEDVQKKVTVRLITLSGQIVDQYMFSNSSRIQLSLDQPNGIYMVEVLDQDLNKSVFRLVKN